MFDGCSDGRPHGLVWTFLITRSSETAEARKLSFALGLWGRAEVTPGWRAVFGDSVDSPNVSRGRVDSPTRESFLSHKLSLAVFVQNAWIVVLSSNN